MSIETIKSGHIDDPTIWRLIDDGENKTVIRHAVRVNPHLCYGGDVPEVTE